VTSDDTELELLLEGHAFLHGDACRQDVEIWVDDWLIETLHFRVGETSPLPARIRVRRRSTAWDVLFLTLLIRKLRSPAETGLSGDQRALGIHVRRLGVVRSGGRFTVDRERLPGVGGEPLKLTSTSVDETPFIMGWGEPETTGRWTVGTEATVAWRLEEGDRDLTLVCDGYAFLSAKAPYQQIELWANDQLVVFWHFADGLASPLPARVVLPLARSVGILFVTFKIRSPRSPAELGLSSDTRALGFHVRTLALVSGSK
jgi:hypothetical protein